MSRLAQRANAVSGDKETTRKRQQELHDELEQLTKIARQAILGLGPDQMRNDFSDIAMAVRRRCAFIQAKHAALTTATSTATASTGATPPVAVEAKVTAPPPAPVVEAAQEEIENDADGDAEEGSNSNDDDAVIPSAQNGWEEVPRFADGVGTVHIYHRKLGGGEEFKKKQGNLRLQVHADTTRRLVVRNGAQLQLNVKAPTTHTLELQKTKNKEFGKILFHGIHDTDRGLELFVLKMSLSNAQQLSDELGGRSN
jgi:hypothetical protein